jgi:hypothetical protein
MSADWNDINYTVKFYRYEKIYYISKYDAYIFM